MTTTMLIFATGVICGSIGVLLGWYLRGKPDEHQIARLMNQIVNIDEMEAQRKRNVSLMAHGKRRSLPRTKAGGPSRVSKVAFRRSSRWS